MNMRKLRIVLRMIYDIPYILFMFFIMLHRFFKMKDRQEVKSYMTGWKMFDLVSDIISSTYYMKKHINICVWSIVIAIIIFNN